MREQLKAKDEQLKAKDEQMREQLKAKDEQMREQLKAKDEQLREQVDLVRTLMGSVSDAPLAQGALRLHNPLRSTESSAIDRQQQPQTQSAANLGQPVRQTQLQGERATQVGAHIHTADAVSYTHLTLPTILLV